MRVVTLLAILLGTTAYPLEELSLKQALDRAIKQNPNLSAQRARVEAADAKVSGQYALSSPMIGLSELKRGNTTTYVSVMQKIEFPTKYFLKAAKQRRETSAQQEKFNQQRLQLRADVISAYYSLYAVQNILKLTKRDLERLKRVSRIAESKYAAGKAPQHDSMKAHVAQTQSESTLIGLRQEEESLQAQLALLINEVPGYRISTVRALTVPDVRSRVSSIKLGKVAASPRVREKQKYVEKASYEKRLARWSYAPDFQLRYQNRLGGAPQDSHIIGVEMSIPLWFWGNSSKSSSASYEEASTKRALAYETQRVVSDLRILRSQIRSEYELYKIFETSLIPQAITSHNSATSAYRANRISFVDYLETERALLQAEIGRFRTMSRYIRSLTQFEAVLGAPIANLGERVPSGEKNAKN